MPSRFAIRLNCAGCILRMPDPIDSGTPRPLKILLLSAGSLLSQNILDALEPRRPRLRVIGADAAPENARLFRCDTAYLTPALDAAAAFEARFGEILAGEEPDIVFPGRDHDVNFLADYQARHPGGRAAIPCGSLQAARIMQDKSLSHEFCLSHDLPCAAILHLRPAVTLEQIKAWLAQTRLPVLAKPCSGYGSLGIKFIQSPGQCESLPRDGSCLLQEFIGPVPDLGEIADSARRGLPFFFTIPVEDQYAAQTLIAPDGGIGEVFCSRSRMVLGRCEASWPVRDEAMASVVRASARAFAGIGWRGSLNVQLRLRPDGGCAIHEFNGRMSGSTSARRLLGYDEVRLLVRAFAGRDLGPAPDEQPPRGEGYVVRSLTDYFVPLAKAAVLRETGRWSR